MKIAGQKLCGDNEIIQNPADQQHDDVVAAGKRHRLREHVEIPLGAHHHGGGGRSACVEQREDQRHEQHGEHDVLAARVHGDGGQQRADTRHAYGAHRKRHRHEHEIGAGLGGGQEEEPEQRHGDHLDHQQEQQVRGGLRQKDHAAVHGHEQDALHAALLLLMVERAVQAQQRREHDKRPQKAAGQLQHIGRLRRLPERRAVDNEHEQRVDAHGHEHLLGAELLLQVLGKQGFILGERAGHAQGHLAGAHPIGARAWLARHLRHPHSHRGAVQLGEPFEIKLIFRPERHHAPARQHQRMRAHVEALAQVVAHHDERAALALLLDQLIEDEGFEAVFIGSGAGLPMFMGIPGENASGVFSANEYLTRSNLMKAFDDSYDTPIAAGKKVAVVGGGNVAMDAARTALRLGAEVHIVYRRSEAELPARAEEVHHAKEEGIIFDLLTNPKEILVDENGHVSGMKVVKMELGEPDASGRRRPVEIPGSEYDMDVDTVIMSLGTSPNPLISSTTKGLEINKRRCIVAEEETGKTSKDGVYAGGDAVTGAATVILAMGAGKAGAKGIDEYLKNK